MEQANTVRTTLDISPELNAKLLNMAEATGGTQCDVLQKCIVLMEIAIQARQQGKKVGMVNQNQPLATEITGILK